MSNLPLIFRNFFFAFLQKRNFGVRVIIIFNPDLKVGATKIKSPKSRGNKNSIKTFFFLFFFLFSFSIKSQNISVSEEIRFASYLIDNAEYRDAIFILNKLNSSSKTIEITPQDSINYFLGWAFYNIKNLDSSIFYFDKIIPQSEFFLKSKFYQAYQNIYLGKMENAITILNSLDLTSDSNLMQIRNFELSGISLLQRDYAKFEALSKSFNQNYYVLSEEEKNFAQYHKKLKAIKFKSPFLAGFFSALLPGSGKYYAGYRGQAISAFVPSALLGAVAAEHLLKNGIKSPAFIIFGGIFYVFYVGNIWGSVLSVKTKRNEQFYETDQHLLNDLHLPLRRIFN